jgi:hypothetical protein
MLCLTIRSGSGLVQRPGRDIAARDNVRIVHIGLLSMHRCAWRRTMAEISRQQRTQMVRRARQIYRARKRAADDTTQIAVAIAEQLPHLLPLEVWRLAHGWTRAEAIDRLAELYTGRGLPAPPARASLGR